MPLPRPALKVMCVSNCFVGEGRVELNQDHPSDRASGSGIHPERSSTPAGTAPGPALIPGHVHANCHLKSRRVQFNSATLDSLDSVSRFAFVPGSFC